MQPKIWLPGLIGALTVMSTVGCYSYRPYGMGAYPGSYMGPPAGTYAPGTAYPPAGYQSGTTYNQPHIVSPGTAQAFPTPADPGSPQNWQQTQKAEATRQPVTPRRNPVQLNPSQDLSEPSSGGSAVPNYEDVQDLGVPDSQPAGIDGFESDGFNDETSTPFDVGDGASIPSTETQQYAQNNNNGPKLFPVNHDAKLVSTVGYEETQPFAATENSGVSNAGFEAPMTHPANDPKSTAAAQQAGLNPYDYDPSHHWLRGVVDYDPSDKTWNLIYDVTPDRDDPFAGSITLADDPRLSVLKNDDVVLVEGSIDYNKRDRRGKPRYRIGSKTENFSRLIPR